MEEGTGLSPISDDLTRWLAEYWRQAVNDIRNEGIQSASDLRHTVQVITGLPSSFLDGRGYSVNAAIAETLDSYVGGIKAPDGYNCVIANYLGSSLAETISDDGCSEAAFHMAYAFLDDNDDVLRSFWQAFLRLAYASPDGDAFHQKATSAFISFMVTNWTDFIPRYARDSLTSRQEGASEGLSLSSFWEDDWTSIPIHIALMPILECLFRLDNTMVLNALDSLREPMLALYLIEKCLASTTLEEFSSAIRLAPLMRADDRTLAWNGSLVLPSMLRVFVDDCINSATNELSSLRGNPASPRIDIPDIIQSATREAELTLGCLVTRPDAPLAFSFLMLELAFSLLSRFSGRGSDADVVGLVTDRLLRIGALIASRERFDQELCRKVAAIVDKQRLYLSATFCSALFLCEDAKNSSAGIENFLNDFTAFLNEASEDNDLYLPDSTLSEGAFSTALGTIISYSDSPSDVVNEALIGLSEVLWRSRFITNPQAALRSHLVLFESSLQAIRSIADRRNEVESPSLLWNSLYGAAIQLWLLLGKSDVEELAERQVLRLLVTWAECLQPEDGIAARLQLGEILKRIGLDCVLLGKVVLWLVDAGEDVSFLEEALRLNGWKLETVLDDFRDSFLLHPQLEEVYGESLSAIRTSLEARV